MVVATAYADELSLRALADIAKIAADHDVRIVGGQMVSLLLTAFPVSGIATRRTIDADAAITNSPRPAPSMTVSSPAVTRPRAATTIHDLRPVPELAAPGRAVAELAVDLLVPSFDGRFRPQEHGGRAFDSAPGLAPALATEPVAIDVSARLLDATVLEFVARVPTVELALVIKALAYSSRLQARDVEDVYRLMEIANAYGSDQIGRWRLNETSLQGSRRDAAAQLHELGRQMRRHTESDVPPARLATLIAALVTRPG